MTLPAQGKEAWHHADTLWDKTLRPTTLDAFVGQQRVCKQLSVMIQAAKERKESLDHCIFVGPPGLGKTTLAHLIAREMGSHVVITAGPAITKAADLAGLLTHLQKGDVLFIDEIHRLQKSIEEYLYPAMEKYLLDLMVDTGPKARCVQLPLQPFTLIGSTTRLGLLSGPLRSRFSLTGHLDYYSLKQLSTILAHSSRQLKLSVENDALLAIAQRSRGTPRIANNLLKWVRDYAQVHKKATVNATIAEEAFQLLSVDKEGLDKTDRQLLRILIERYQGGPVGIKPLSAVMGEEEQTIEEVHEPYLVAQGFILRTPRGREATERAYQHLQLMKESITSKNSL